MELLVENCMEDDKEESTAKKSRTSEVLPSLKEEITLNSTNTQEVINNERCGICKQYMDSVLLYNGHPNDSVDEYIALTDERLMLFTGKETEIHEDDEFPANKVKYFTNFQDCFSKIGFR